MRIKKRDINGLNLFSYYRDDNGNTLLHKAVEERNIGLVRYYSQDKKLINSVNNACENALHICATLNFVDEAIALIEHGIDIDAQNGLGWTPLMQSMLSKSNDVFLLLAKLKYKYVRTEKEVRKGRGSKTIVNYEKVRYKFNYKLVDNCKLTPFHYAYALDNELFINELSKRALREKHFFVLNDRPSWFNPNFLRVFTKKSFFEYNYQKDKKNFNKAFYVDEDYVKSCFEN